MLKISTVAESTKRPKLILVDDDESVRAAVQRLLAADFEVLAAHSATQALDLLDTNRDVAVVLTDQSMYGMKGLELLGVVESKAPGAVRALITGQIDMSEIAGAINSSRIHRLILKPWNNEYFRVQMMEAMASHSTLREKIELERLAVTDPVTGLKNHRYFQDRLRIETERATRHGRDLSLIMADIDHFKQFNDKYGHPAGDRVLRAAAQRIQDQVRSVDTVARYGGEEFAVILPETPGEGARLVAERIRTSFERERFELPGTEPVTVRVSLGFASLGSFRDLQPAPATGPKAAPVAAFTASTLVTKADENLYRAKGQGRNQTVGA